MGGDRAPAVVVEGAVRAARAFGEGIVLVGRREAIEPELSCRDTTALDLSVVHASEIIEMGEHPAMAAKSKKDSSMAVGMRMVRKGEADAFASAGNSGGVLANALLHLGRLKGVIRPALTAVFPTEHGPSVLLDVGANTDCRPEQLVQFAVMGSVYANCVLGIQNPRVGIISNGEEEGKGNALVQDTYPLLRSSQINFIGNVEGKDIPKGMADILVTDGFTGNVILKTSEGVASMLMDMLRREIKKRPAAVLGALLARGAFKEVRKTLDYAEYGGAPLLGVAGVVVLGHGRSSARAITNMVGVAVKAVRAHTMSAISQGIQEGVLDHSARERAGAVDLELSGSAGANR